MSPEHDEVRWSVAVPPNTDEEVLALYVVARALDTLTDAAAGRVAAWASNRYPTTRETT